MTNLQEMGKRACEAKYVLQMASTEEKNRALTAAARALCGDAAGILAANALDIRAGEDNGMHPGMLDR